MENSDAILKKGFKIVKSISIFPITNKTTNSFTVDGNAWMLLGWAK